MQKTLPVEYPPGTHKGNRWHQIWLLVARTACIIFTSSATLLFFFSLSTYYAQLVIVCPTLPGCSFAAQLSKGTLPWFQSIHLSVSTYAVIYLTLATLDALLSLIIGIVIVWRLWGTSNEVLGLLTAFVLIFLGTIAIDSGFTNFSPDLPFFLQTVGAIGFILFWPAVGTFLLIFPTGSFVPRWTWIIILLWVIQIPLYGLLQNGSPLLFAAELLLVYGSSFAVLYWRYQHLFTHAQKQQTKWMLYGLVPFYLIYILYGAFQSIPALNTPSSLYLDIGPIFILLIHLMIPLGVGIAMLRYRLWDIDVLINRTLVYGLLTATLLLIYLILVFAGQALVAHIFGSNNGVVLVVSTLVVAGLFQPLRSRVQQQVDRRFYRRKYDAAKTLAAFSATLRSEVDLDQLRGHLLSIVQETMQPAHITLWLRQPSRETSSSLEISKTSNEEVSIHEQNTRHGT
jgi:hypothetical protein